ncbi:sigma-54 interaction domain-containing protein [Pelotomaculum propionicicum]|uniref:Limonene hydroxylase n=1 Tax=Pelotomaculum propionicicum TaxID=258475 RepID=A0A4Y7RJE3_9FIRM|nr:sigma 54-interacting transcriptional regulator [Pelotomaculum propionicicum]TEB09105.1 Limonene hydroxylase [Pelotomaculum propionicicum]
MGDSSLKKWRNLHSGDYHLSLDAETAKSWDRCYSQNIDPEKSTFESCTDTEFDIIKKNSTEIYAYTNRIIMALQEYLRNPHVGFALFDNNACLLKLYGSGQFLQWAEAKGITPKTIWREECAGTNAVSLGLELNKPLYFDGPDNFLKVLCDVVTYFTPFSLEDELNEGLLKKFGGVAIIGPDSEKDLDYLVTVISISKDVCMHLYLVVNTYHSISNPGLMHIDIEKAKNKMHILYHSSTIFDIFNITPVDLNFKNLQTIFDPYPQNKEFWEIIDSNRQVKNYNTKLSILGKENNYVLSSEPYKQSSLGFQGIKLVFESEERISSYVSRKIGNAQLTFSDIIGKNTNFIKTIYQAKRVALSDSNVLILGESGVGKDIFAQAIHNASSRKNKPFIALNCAAFPRDLIASELFGYEAGAFTGSKKGGNLGKFELANTGTIFLDEIGDMPLDLQAMLLRIIEQKSFMRLGSNTQIHVDVKIIAATNTDLIQKIKQRKFREDLYYRLSTIRLRIPALRERQDDIELLTNHFIKSISSRTNMPKLALSGEAMEMIKNLPWKGNVRELQNTIEGIFQLYPDTVILPCHIKEYLDIPEPNDLVISTAAPLAAAQAETNTENINGPAHKRQIEEALRINKYNITNTSSYLGVSRKTLYRWLKKYNLQ